MNNWGKRKIVLLIMFALSLILIGYSFYQFVSRDHLPESGTVKSSPYIEQVSGPGNGWAWSDTVFAMVLLVTIFFLLLREVTVHRKMIEELKMQKEHFSITISSIDEGLITTCRNGGILYMNPAAERLTGWRNDEVKNHPFEKIYNVVNEETEKPIEHIVNRVLRHKKVVPSENNTLLLTKDKKKLIISNSGSPLFDSKGEISGAVLVFNDISEKKKIEIELRESEKKYRTLIEQASDAIFISDRDGTILEANYSASKMLGYTNEELAVMNTFQLYTEDYLSTRPYLYEKMQRGEVIRLERYLTPRLGPFVPVEITSKMFSDGRVMSIVRDISDRKKAELKIAKAVERYDILAEATSDTIWDWDILNNRMLFNTKITKMFGYGITEVDDVKQWRQENIHPEDLPIVMDAYYKSIENNSDTIQLEYRFRCADGGYKHIYDRAFVVYNGTHKEPVRMIGAMQDVTYAKEEEKKIAKAIIDAQEQERRFIGQELHDNVNQLLASSLLTIGEIKHYRNNEDKIEEYVEITKSHIHAALNEIRKLSHELVPATFDGATLKDIFESLLQEINIKNQFVINFQFDEKINALVCADLQINLYRILQEQVRNILTYANAKAINLTVCCKGDVVIMRTVDNGIGFDSKKVKAGIGLNNMKRRVESFGGIFSIKSQPGKGCEIIIEIPTGKNRA